MPKIESSGIFQVFASTNIQGLDILELALSEEGFLLSVLSEEDSNFLDSFIFIGKSD